MRVKAFYMPQWAERIDDATWLNWKCV